MIELYYALLHDDGDRAVHAYHLWGFKDLTNEMIEALNMWARFLYSPLLEDRSRKIQETEQKGVYGQDIAEKVHAQLKKLGGITPPREFVFMDRAALGLCSVFIHLKADINWYRLFNDMIEGFDVGRLEKNQSNLLG